MVVGVYTRVEDINARSHATRVTTIIMLLRTLIKTVLIKFIKKQVHTKTTAVFILQRFFKLAYIST